QQVVTSYRMSSRSMAKRKGITRLKETNEDENIDEYKVIWSQPVTGNYHEYFYGPLFTPYRDMLVPLNLAWTGKDMKSLSKWDGWLLKISPKGEVEPIATGLRSPSGFGYNAEGDLFY